MSKVLITGGCGYVGSHVNKCLSQKGHQTVVLDNLVHGHREFAKWGRLVEMDLGDRAGLEKLLAAEKFDAVLHFAGYIAVGESVREPETYYRNNVGNSLILLAAMRQAGLNRIIFSSTAAVYGDPVQIPLGEDHPLAPINPYGRTKLIIEQALRDFSAAYGLRSAALRYFNAAGAAPGAGIGERHVPETHLIPLVLGAALGKRPEVSVYGADYDTPDGTCLRDYIHVDDLAEAHVLALEYLEQGGGTDCFNLGNGNGFSVQEVISTARKVTGREIKAEITPRREGDAPRLIASSDKAKRILNWKPRYTDLGDIVKTAWEWHKV
ncbi:MAG: UDP-glucose 4-epimerase GalE [Candidatus Edwardsbacteria bacterium]|nr:UDP-glucose 4-epimerase GalE [Candidatus Edwardsbacteria bacterium]MBU1577342.1 UDP-glucose 4-epimerase GalE [Candidatus Edwardsbacteria bacterium]MBU2594189.1 UDP-glucose 4-epimerase GalE [Candidatus Edwardsbacteria bacterium]